MANWAYTDYVIEGPEETLNRLLETISHPSVIQEGSDERWEGNVLLSLGLSWNQITPDNRGDYLRGFIEDSGYIDEKGNLRFCAQEAWGLTDFYRVLERNIHDIKVYWYVEEENMAIYGTNDKEGKYFPARFYVDTCINNNYQSEFFNTEESAFQWLSDLTQGKIKSVAGIEAFNEQAEDSDDFIAFHTIKVLD